MLNCYKKPNREKQSIKDFKSQWGIECDATPHKDSRQLYMLKRSAGRFGSDLGKTTGWAHRAGLLAKGVTMIPGVSYDKIDDEGLHITVEGNSQVLPVDNIIICAGQEPMRDIVEGLNMPYHLIGGADEALELDAKRAIDQGTRVCAAV